MLAPMETELLLTKELCISDLKVKLAGRDSDGYFRNAENQIQENAFLLCAARHTLNGSGCIIDIGANIGITTSLLAKSRPYDDIYAIEPSLGAFSDLKRTIAVNNFTNVKAINIGLGAESGRLILNEDPSNSSAANFSSEISLGDTYIRGVVIQKLDDFCLAHGVRPHFLKIDVEGFEINVLKGGLRTIKECSPVVFIEINSFTTLAYGRVNPLEVMEFLRNNFDSVLWINESDIEHMDNESLFNKFLHAHYSRNSGIDDLLCIPRGVSINKDALRSDIKQLRREPSSATSARLEAVLNSTTWKIAKNIQRLAKPLRGIQRLTDSFKSRFDRRS